MFKLALKRWGELGGPDAPPEFKEALSKLDIDTMEVALANAMIIAVYNVKEEDLSHLQLLAMYLADAFDIETIPVCPMEEHGKAAELYMKVTGGN